jgi:hypothetical protein
MMSSISLALTLGNQENPVDEAQPSYLHPQLEFIKIAFIFMRLYTVLNFVLRLRKVKKLNQ